MIDAFESSNTKSPIVDHEIGQNHINSPDASPKRSLSSESFTTNSSLDKASIPAKPERAPLKHIFGGHECKIYSFVFLHDNQHIVSGSQDDMLCKWDCETGLLVGEPWEAEGGKIWALALSPDGKTIACGRGDGIVQRWNTDGEMSEGIWMGHSDSVRSLAWSPNGGHIASGSSDTTILIRKAENGEVEVGPIKAGQDWLRTLAYSPSGDRIASGGYNETICIWDSNTGKLLVGPIKDLGTLVTSVVWSSDSSKLYSASDNCARVFDSFSGKELYRFEHNDSVNSVALSPKHNLLACVGNIGIAQLWDTQSYQPLGKVFSSDDSVELRCVSFSRDGRYLACSEDNMKITLWMVKDIAPELLSSSSFLEVDSTNSFARPGGDDMEDGHDNLYGNFFESLEPSHPFEARSSFGASQVRNLLSLRRLWNVFIPSRHGPLADQSIHLQSRINRGFSQYTRPQPVTVSAARPRKLYWTVPRSLRRVVPENESLEEDSNASAHAGQSSTAAEPPHAAAPCLTPQGPQNVRAQPATPPPHEDEPDYGCWGNFRHAVCCIPHAHGIVSAVQPATS